MRALRRPTRGTGGRRPRLADGHPRPCRLAGQRAPFTGVQFLACSGARTYNVRLADDEPEPKPHEQRGEGDADENDTQLQQYVDRYPVKDDRTPELVVVSIGGNDAGFATIVLMCVAPGDCSERKEDWYAGLERSGRSSNWPSGTSRDLPTVPVPGRHQHRPVSRSRRGAEAAATGRDRAGRETATCSPWRQRASIHRGVHPAAQPEGHGGSRSSRLGLLDRDGDGARRRRSPALSPPQRWPTGPEFHRSPLGVGDPSHRFYPSNWTHNILHPNERGHAAMLRVFQRWSTSTSMQTRASCSLTRGERGDGRGPAVRRLRRPGAVVLQRSRAGGCISEGRDWAARTAGVHRTPHHGRSCHRGAGRLAREHCPRRLPSWPKPVSNE